jgi:hypothetical protein
MGLRSGVIWTTTTSVSRSFPGSSLLFWLVGPMRWASIVSAQSPELSVSDEGTNQQLMGEISISFYTLVETFH